ncbi:MAG: hypothetical protein KBS53_00900 [Bacteroidales bacterium]|nr:hypothetical protein [Candidatus Hennigimonas equi]
MLKKYGAYLTAIVVFVLLAVIYCKPQLSGKVVSSGDIITYTSAIQEAVRYTQETGDYTWWNGNMFSGMPNYRVGGGRFMSSVLLNPIKKILHREDAIWIFILYFFCFFVLLRSFGIDKWLSIVGSIAISLSSYFIVIIAAGHITKTSTIASISVVMAGLYLIFRKKYGIGAILVMVFSSVGVNPHPQMSYYLFMLMGLMWIAELWIHIKGKRIRDFAVGTVIFAMSLGIGVGTNTDVILVNKEYMTQTMRGGHSDIVDEDDTAEPANQNGLDIKYATEWSYGMNETFSFLIPGFMGGANRINVGTDSKLYKTLIQKGMEEEEAADFCRKTPMYWGDQPFTAGNVYMGAVVCFLFLLGLMIVKGPYKWVLLVATLLSTALAWGHNCMWLTEFFFKYFPLYNKFRSVSSILVVAEISMPLLGFLALKQIMDGTVNRKTLFEKMSIAAGITGGICLRFALWGDTLFDFMSFYDTSWAGNFPEWLYEAVLAQRAELLRFDGFRSFAFILAAFLLIWIYANGKLKSGWMIAILGVLIIADMWPVDKRYFNDDSFVSPRQMNDAFSLQKYEEQLLQDPSHFRVLNLSTSTWTDPRTSYYLKSIGGYSAVKLRRYQDLIDQHLSRNHWPVINMLNTKYLILPGDDGQPQAELNPHAFGNAWFVDKLHVVENANEESDALNTIDLSHEAVLDRSFSHYVTDFEPSIPEDASIVLNKYTPKELDYTCISSAPGTVVFSEIYYPYGWKATIDGVPVDHYRVNYLLRALNVPAGKHNIHFIFAPDSARKGGIISIICIILMYIACACIIAYGIFKRK